MAEKSHVLEVFATMPHYPTHKEKTRRALRAYVDLIDTGEWFKSELRGPLETFGVTMGEYPDAYQRMLRRERLPKVQEFVTRPDAMLPTNIVVHLSDKVLVEDVPMTDVRDSQSRPVVLSRATKPVVLNIPLEFSSLELIDGQHRLFGFVGTDPATRKSFDLLVTGVKDLSGKQRQEAFVAINDNSRRMDPNLVAYLRYTTDLIECQRDGSLMAIRVVVDLNDRTPFKGSIRLLDVGEQSITLKGFAGYDLKGLLGNRGLLRKC